MIKEYDYIFFLLFIGFTSIQVIYYLGVFGRLLLHKSKKKQEINQEAVSVVICARNEYRNLEEFLPLILEQDYPDFEVVVVNDRSEDDSIFLLNQMRQKYPHLKVIDFTQELNFFKGKKFPLSVGIKSAKNDILLLTDADCYPNSNQWIKEIANAFDEKTEIVLGYGAYAPSKGILNKIIRFDAFRIALLYLSAAVWKQAYMGIGRNLAYRKSLFYKMHGFSAHYKILSGDDDLFINAASNKQNTKIILSSDSLTISKPKENLSQWVGQKTRHLSTSKYYKPKHKLFLLFWELSNYFVWIFLGLTLASLYEPIYTLSTAFTLLLIKIVVYQRAMLKLSEKKLAWFSILWDGILLFIYPIISILSKFKKQKSWK